MTISKLCEGSDCRDATVGPFSQRRLLVRTLTPDANFSDHDTVGCSLQTASPTKHKPCRKIYQYAKSEYDAIIHTDTYVPAI